MNMLPREVERAETSRTGNVIASNRPFLGTIRRWIQGHIDLRKQRPHIVILADKLLRTDSHFNLLS
jgi:hypothetical protein